MSPSPEIIPWDHLRQRLCVLHRHLQQRLVAARQSEGERAWHEVQRMTRADVIYRVDEVTESVIIPWFRSQWPTAYPVEVVMEGQEDAPLTFPVGTPVAQTRVKCIIDPIDGTRPFMYDKRSAWTLSALAPQRGEETSLADIQVAVMTELPCRKQYLADQLSCCRGQPVASCRLDAVTGRLHPWHPKPMASDRLDHAFASFVKFFPTGKAMLAQIEEDLFARLGTANLRQGPPIFDDQYLSTGGQIYELASGHDAFIADIRPLVHARLGLPERLCCHPYDICTAMILQSLGGIVEKPDGSPLDAPLDTTTPVAWVGYANAQLAERIRPVLQQVLSEALDDFLVPPNHDLAMI